MNTPENFEKLYITLNEEYNFYLKNSSLDEKNIPKLISKLFLDDKFTAFFDNGYNTVFISNFFRYYEELMKNSFKEDKQTFNFQFNCYILIIKLFYKLCKIFALKKEKRDKVEPILQILKESINMSKLFISFENSQLCIMNNLIGQQLYKFSHMLYFNTKNRTLDYLLEYYLYSCEKIIDGYQLCLFSNFGKSSLENKEMEKIKAKNNLSFLLLTMHYKIDFYFPLIQVKENPNYKKICHYICESKFFEEKYPKDLKNFLLDEFIDTTKFLLKNGKYHYYNEKILLLTLDTDEYKELIDIITPLKQ